MSEKDLQRINHPVATRPNEENLQDPDSSQLMNRQNQYSSTTYSTIPMLMTPAIPPMYSQPIRNNNYYFAPINYGNTQNIGVPTDPYMTQLPVTPLNPMHIARPDTGSLTIPNDSTYHPLQPIPNQLSQEMLAVDESMTSMIIPNDLNRKRKRTQWNDQIQELDKQPPLAPGNASLSYYPSDSMEPISTNLLIQPHLQPQQEKQILKLFENLDKDGYKLTDQFMQETIVRITNGDSRSHAYKADPPTFSYIHQLLKKSAYFKNKDLYLNDPSKKPIDNETFNHYYMNYIIAMPPTDETYYSTQRVLPDTTDASATIPTATTILPSTTPTASAPVEKDFEYKEKRKYTNSQLQWAMNATSKGVSTREAARQAHVPRSTLHDKIHNQRSSKPGKPTVLRSDEEVILATFVTLLDGQGIRIPRDDVKKLVMGMLPGERGHPFKDDGPHRHWFRGFYKRNPQIMIYRNQSSPIPRTKLKQEQMDQFFEEVQRLRDENLISFAAQRPQYARLDRTGFHFNIPHDPMGITPLPYSSTTIPSNTINTNNILNSSIPLTPYPTTQPTEEGNPATATLPGTTALEKSSAAIHPVTNTLLMSSIIPDVSIPSTTNPTATQPEGLSMTLPTAAAAVAPAGVPPTAAGVNPSASSSLHSLPIRKKWTQESLIWAVDQVMTGRLNMKDASAQSGVPIATIRNNLKNPNSGGKRGPPTVLTDTEELALERFLIKLDDWGYKANREELAKIVMNLVNQDGRDHPFKQDGPHRHWFQGFYRRHAILDARRRASGTTLSRQDAPPELMKKFYDELNEVKMQAANEDLNKSKKKSLTLTINNSVVNATNNAAASVTNGTNPLTTASSTNPSELSVNPMGETALSVNPADQSGATSLTMMQDSKAMKRGGRPKMPLFSVQPCRQKYRTNQIMQYIRDFAIDHDENVDDILWSLLIQRVKGSGYKEIADLLQQLCKRWSEEIQIGRLPQQVYDDPLPAMISPMMDGAMMANEVMNPTMSPSLLSHHESTHVGATHKNNSNDHTSVSVSNEVHPNDTTTSTGVHATSPGSRPSEPSMVEPTTISSATNEATNPTGPSAESALGDVAQPMHSSLFSALTSTVPSSLPPDLNNDISGSMPNDINTTIHSNLSIPAVPNVNTIMPTSVVDGNNEDANFSADV